MLRKHQVVLGVFMAVLMTSGCASLPTPPRRHFILIDKEGYPVSETKGERIQLKEFERDYVGPILQGIDEYVKKELAEGRTPRLLVFVHGGLNQYSDGLGRVERLLAAQKLKAEYPALSSHYLVFLNWDGSLWSSVADDLVFVRGGKRREWWKGVWVAPFMFAARLAEAVLSAPETWWFQLDSVGDSLRRSEEGDDSCDPRRAPVIEAKLKDVDLRKTASYVPLFPLRLAVPIAIQGFGRPAWDMLQRRADSVFSMERTEGREDPKAGVIFMERLKERIPEKGRWSIEGEGKSGELQITLVGHSMGTLVLNRLLARFHELYFDRIVYLAAAASIREVETVGMGYLRTHRDAKLWSFSLSQTDEASEQNPGALGERGTLLLWIDNLFGRVTSPSRKTFGRYENLQEYVNFSPESFTERRVTLVKFNGRDDYGRDPREHGDFNKPEVLERILEAVETGQCPP